MREDGVPRKIRGLKQTVVGVGRGCRERERLTGNEVAGVGVHRERDLRWPAHVHGDRLGRGHGAVCRGAEGRPKGTGYGVGVADVRPRCRRAIAEDPLVTDCAPALGDRLAVELDGQRSEPGRRRRGGRCDDRRGVCRSGVSKSPELVTVAGLREVDVVNPSVRPHFHPDRGDVRRGVRTEGSVRDRARQRGVWLQPRERALGKIRKDVDPIH